MIRRSVPIAALLVTVGLRARAQCPDGTPPPCGARAVSVAGAAAKRADPPLDANTWIVLPFDNLARIPEAEWLRDASVNLLYLDLSKWRDIRVIDDERVADLLRELPERGRALTLASGLTVARHAGAGKLVMGDLIRIGAKTTMTAKIFDVKGGQRIRTATQEAPALDSLMPAFGRLARGILNVAPPTGTKIGEIGTTNTGAYQEYLEGVKALNRFDLVPARAHLDAALKLDSTFALAHYKLATLIGWDDPANPAKTEHARAASRFSAALPPREHALVAGLLSFDNAEHGRACAIYGSLIKADSTDVEALYGMGECLWHDNVVEAVNGDTTRLRFRGSWNSAIRVFQRTLAIDPTFHLAFQHILDTYVAEGRTGCRLNDTTALTVVNATTSCAAQYSTALRRDGDSLLMVPVDVRDQRTLTMHLEEARATNARRVNIQKARAIAKEWVDAGAESRAIATLGRIDLMLGDITAADDELSHVRFAELGDVELGRSLLARLEIDWKLGRDGRVIRMVDSMAATHPKGQSAQFAAIGLASTGRIAAYDSLLAAQLARGRAPPAVLAYFRTALRVMLGLTPDSAGVAESAFFSAVSAGPPPQGGSKNAVAQITPTLMFGLRLNRQQWPALDSVANPRLGPAVALAKGDTARLRAAAKRLDDGAITVADDGSAIVAADAYLVLKDSAAALATLRLFLDHRLAMTPMFTGVNGYLFSSFLWARTQLLRAELEAAIGDKAKARAGFGHVLALWANADAEFQPMLERARKGLAALGPG